MPLELMDVTPSVPNPPLVPFEGALLPPSGAPILQTYVLGRWGLYGAQWPVGPIAATASLYTHDHDGQTLHLATVVFMNEDMGRQAYGFWKTFRVLFPDACYDACYDDELVSVLRQSLTDTAS